MTFQKTTYLIEPCDLESDGKTIITLWESALSAQGKEERLKHLYQNTPYGKGSLWLARYTKTNTHVGVTGLIKRPIFINGKQFAGGIAADFAVDKGHRTFGPALQLQRALINDLDALRFDIIYGYPNKAAIKVLVRAGYHLLGQAHRWVKLLRVNHKIDKFTYNPLGKYACSLLGNTALKMISRENRYRRSTDVHAEILQDIDERFDHLWKEVIHKIPVVGMRDTEYLKWRYITCEQNHEVFCVTISPNTKTIVGYIICNIRDNICHIQDILTSNLGKSFDLTMGAFTKLMHQKGVYAISITYLGTKTFENKLIEWNFSQREDANDIVVAFSKTIPSFNIEILKNPDNWYLIEGDDL